MLRAVCTSTVAAATATALQFARAGQSVLLAELGSRSFFGPLRGLAIVVVGLHGLERLAGYLVPAG